jgi:hypothetical protein
MDWQTYYNNLKKLGILENSDEDLLLRFFVAAQQLKFHMLPDAVVWSENSFFILSWFEHNFFIILDPEKLEITKLPGPDSSSFNNEEKCISHLIQNSDFYFGSSFKTSSGIH